MLAHTERTTDATFTGTPVEVLSLGVVEYDGITPVEIELFCSSLGVPAGVGGYLVLWDGATNLGQWGEFSDAGGGSTTHPVLLRRRLTPTPGPHTYRVVAHTGGGTGVLRAGSGGGPGQNQPAYMRALAEQGGASGGGGGEGPPGPQGEQGEPGPMGPAGPTGPAGSGGGGGGALAYVERGEDVALSTTVVDVLSSGPVECDGNPVLIEFFCAAVACFATGAEVQFLLYDGGTAVGRLSQIAFGAYGSPPVLLRRRLGQGEYQDFTPSAGTHTFTVKGVTTSSTATAKAGFGSHAYDLAPMSIRVTSD